MPGPAGGVGVTTGGSGCGPSGVPGAGTASPPPPGFPPITPTGGAPGPVPEKLGTPDAGVAAIAGKSAKSEMGGGAPSPRRSVGAPAVKPKPSSGGKSKILPRARCFGAPSAGTFSISPNTVAWRFPFNRSVRPRSPGDRARRSRMAADVCASLDACALATPFSWSLPKPKFNMASADTIISLPTGTTVRRFVRLGFNLFFTEA